IVQFEGMHHLAPDNEDALYLLTQSWVGYGYAFAEDDMEAAMDAGKDDLVQYHKERALAAYERAVGYGLQWLKAHAEGFDEAKKNANTIKSWLADNFTSKDDAPYLFWLGYGWMARVNIAK